MILCKVFSLQAGFNQYFSKFYNHLSRKLEITTIDFPPTSPTLELLSLGLSCLSATDLSPLSLGLISDNDVMSIQSQPPIVPGLKISLLYAFLGFTLNKISKMKTNGNPAVQSDSVWEQTQPTPDSSTYGIFLTAQKLRPPKTVQLAAYGPIFRSFSAPAPGPAAFSANQLII